MKEVERLKEVEAAVHVQTMEFLEKKRNQLQEDVDAWDARYAIALPQSGEVSKVPVEYCHFSLQCRLSSAAAICSAG